MVSPVNSQHSDIPKSMFTYIIIALFIFDRLEVLRAKDIFPGAFIASRRAVSAKACTKFSHIASLVIASQHLPPFLTLTNKFSPPYSYP
jgi:hypothetical protein